MTLPADLNAEIQKLAPSAMIELFELDATTIGGDLLRFHAGTNGLHQNLVWDGNTYVRFPLQISGFEFSGQGQFPRPKLSVSNALSAISVLIMQFGDLLGAKVTRRRTLAKYLDAVNFPGGVNASADPTAEFSSDVYFIDRKSGEDYDAVEFELAASVDLAGVAIPRRQIIQNVCGWKYRGPECDFTGPPLFDKDDQPIATASTPEGQDLIDTYAVIAVKKLTLDEAIRTLSELTYAQGASCDIIQTNSAFDLSAPFQQYYGSNVVVNGNYGVYQVIFSNGYSQNITVARWGGGSVSLGETYRIGALVSSVAGYSGFTINLYRIEYWELNPACAGATSAAAAASTARIAAQTDYDNAVAAHEAAIDALPSDDPLYIADRCGKRLASCKLRFGKTAELSFGSFPASGLIR